MRRPIFFSLPTSPPLTPVPSIFPNLALFFPLGIAYIWLLHPTERPHLMSEEKALNFLEEIIENDLASGKHNTIVTRFPPEPNGYLHIGHAKSICLNFGLAKKYGGTTNLRFDDTNPVTEETEYVESIKQDIQWLGFTWANELYASNYFDQLYLYAVDLIQKGLAYVDDSDSETMAAEKGTHTQPGIQSRYRDRNVEENLELFEGMKRGLFKDGERTLRAKIDMASHNMLLRDPIIYRIKHAHHHRTGDAWCIYPMYDFAHGQSDSIEGITHSICTLEFIPHRELYEWLIDKLGIYPSKQYEFARLNMTYTVMSKRKMLRLVNEKYVNGWDDPRMPTISGMRRRGFTPASIRNFCDRIGVARRENLIDFGLLEFCVREDLNHIALRRMVVMEPLVVEIINYEGDGEDLPTENNPEDPEAGERTVRFGKHIFIEQEDFMENPPKKYFRLSPGQTARLKGAYIIRCEDLVKDENGKPVLLRCTYYPDSKSGSDTSGINVKATIHWVNAEEALPIEIRLYDRLFTEENVGAAEGDFKNYVNPDSLRVVSSALAEPSLRHATIGDRFQFLRKGYFALDPETTQDKIVFNRTVTLKDTWSKSK